MHSSGQVLRWAACERTRRPWALTGILFEQVMMPAPSATLTQITLFWVTPWIPNVAQYPPRPLTTVDPGLKP